MVAFFRFLCGRQFHAWLPSRWAIVKENVSRGQRWDGQLNYFTITVFIQIF